MRPDAEQQLSVCVGCGNRRGPWVLIDGDVVCQRCEGRTEGWRSAVDHMVGELRAVVSFDHYQRGGKDGAWWFKHVSEIADRFDGKARPEHGFQPCCDAPDHHCAGDDCDPTCCGRHEDGFQAHEEGRPEGGYPRAAETGIPGPSSGRATTIPNHPDTPQGPRS